MKPYLNNLSGKSKSDITTFSGGLNACYDKSYIQDNQLPFMMNVTLLKAPTLSVRSNRRTLAFYMDDTTNYGTGEILKIFATSDKTLIEIEKRNNDSIHVYEFKKSGGFITKTYIGSVENSAKYWMTECRDSKNKYIFIATNNKLYKITKNIFKTELEEVTNESNPISGVLANHKNRLFVGNGIDLYISKLRQYDDFTVLSEEEQKTATEKQKEESGHQLRITNADGDIKALIPYDGKLLIFCERSRHILYGSSPISEVDQFTLVDFDDGIGCISDESYTICDRQLFWLDRDMSVYRYNGSYTNKISEPYGNDDYASYGGISEISYNPFRIDNFVMSSYGDYVYISLTRSRLVGSVNDTVFVYDTKNRVWWVEDGDFSHMVKWESDEIYLLGSKYNDDILILNCLQNSGQDMLFNMTTRNLEEVNIKYSFETKTWNLGTIKNKKTLTNVWFQANAEAKVGVCDYWSNHNQWDTEFVDIDKDYLVLGKLEDISMRHNVQRPYFNSHEGGERQRFIVPKMYMQKINAFSIRVDGEGYGEFFLLEKEWRIR